ncbi:hypothetical protein [Rhodobacter calidifons]|uniref:Uncharacterized protein n=1 Tax=Rhodobacter calidifons TaxID=2715277 RepID=A0ABX0G2H5_9RHOB|nr:hypothetical protein [Rhodobacter calidifons]NHB75291.1 hypothetical protein [Rhodobacter calidifons]
MAIDVSTLGYGILALSNPAKWPNESQQGVDFLITGKEAYIWALIVESYIINGNASSPKKFEAGIEKIGFYAHRYFEQYFKAYPPDFADAGQQYTSAKRGLFQSVKGVMGNPIRTIGVGEAAEMLSREFRSLESKGYIVDPFIEALGGVTVAVLGAVPYSFTKRTESGDQKYLKVKALLWEYERLSEGEKDEIRFHFFMEKAIERVKAIAIGFAAGEKKID